MEFYTDDTVSTVLATLMLDIYILPTVSLDVVESRMNVPRMSVRVSFVDRRVPDRVPRRLAVADEE